MALGNMFKHNNVDCIEGSNGLLFKLGCNVPNKLRYDFKTLSTEVNPFSRDDAIKLVGEREFKARKTFSSSFTKDQKSHGSCCGFACSYGNEKSRYLRGLKYIRLGGASVYAQINGNRDEGGLLRDGMEALVNVGELPESIAPWDKIYKSQYPKDIWEKIAYRFKAFECYHVMTEMDVVTALLNNFMLIVAVHVTDNFMRLDKNGVVGRSLGVGNHAVNIDDVRYFNGEFQFDLHNSWGNTWGEDGRGWITWDNHLESTVNNHEFFAIRSTLNDPEDDEFPTVKLSTGEEIIVPVEYPITV